MKSTTIKEIVVLTTEVKSLVTTLIPVLQRLIVLMCVTLPQEFIEEVQSQFKVWSRPHIANLKVYCQEVKHLIDTVQEVSDTLFPQESIDSLFYLIGRSAGYVWKNRILIGDTVFGCI